MILSSIPSKQCPHDVFKMLIILFQNVWRINDNRERYYVRCRSVLSLNKSKYLGDFTARTIRSTCNKARTWFPHFFNLLSRNFKIRQELIQIILVIYIDFLFFFFISGQFFCNF